MTDTDYENFNELFEGEDRKLNRRERKLASSKDRSKYKKTDSDKLKKHAEEKYQSQDEQSPLKIGRVISIASEGIIVDYQGQFINCVLRGTLKKEKTQHKNLVIVGDFVRFEPMHENEGVISFIEPRKSILSRADNLSQRKQQLIAANIDQVLITTSVINPPIKPSLIDRYIIAADKGGMQSIIVVNKIDLLQASYTEEADQILVETEKEIYEEFILAYAQAGIQVIPVSSETGQGLQALEECMKGKASVFSGQSGVGKSSLINRITGLNLRVGEVVERTKKGSHTTSTANLIPLPFGGWCIDTPGIKSFGVWDLQKEELLSYFPEIMAQGKKCKFPNCTHVHEPDCAIEKAIDEGDVSLMRYQSYYSLLQELGEEHLRR